MKEFGEETRFKIPRYPINTEYGLEDYYCYALITTYHQSWWYEEVHRQFEKSELKPKMPALTNPFQTASRLPHTTISRSKHCFIIVLTKSVLYAHAILKYLLPHLAF